MAYLGDIRENSISPEGIIWENDNRKDARHYWNGALVDLCDLPGEDYAKTIFVTSGSGSPDTPSKDTNVITIQLVTSTDEYGNSVFAYKAMSRRPVTSDVNVVMTIVDEFGAEEEVTLTVVAGSSSSPLYMTAIPSAMAEPKILTADYNPKEDDKFIYDTVLPEEKPVYPMAYSITLLNGEIDTISDDELVERLKESGVINMKNEQMSEKFMVEFKAIPVEGLSDMSVVEMSNALINNSQDIIIVTDKTIKSIAQAELPDINEFSLWTKRESDVIIEGKTFSVFFKRDSGQTSQSKVYDPVTNEVVGTEDREYIISYE